MPPEQNSAADLPPSQGRSAAVPDERGKLPSNDGSAPSSSTAEQTHKQLESDALDRILGEEARKKGEPVASGNRDQKPNEAQAKEGSGKGGADSAKSVRPHTDPKAGTPERGSGGDGNEQDIESLRKSLAGTKMSFHQSRRELKEERTKREGLEKELAALREQIKSGNIERGAVDMPQTAKKIIDGLSPAAKKLVSETPELTELLVGISNNLGEGIVREELSRVSEAAEKKETIVREDKYMSELLQAYPDFDEVVATKEFKTWRDSNAEVVDGILDKFDELDPKGAIAVRKAFEKAKDGRQSKGRQAIPPAVTPDVTGRSAARLDSSGEPTFDRAREEAEALERILEKENRRA